MPSPDAIDDKHRALTEECMQWETAYAELEAKHKVEADAAKTYRDQWLLANARADAAEAVLAALWEFGQGHGIDAMVPDAQWVCDLRDILNRQSVTGQGGYDPPLCCSERRECLEGHDSDYGSSGHPGPCCNCEQPDAAAIRGENHDG
jgi:hypothetical protein